MPDAKINDSVLLRLIDIEKVNQSEAARRFGVSRQAVGKRLQELRGRTTRAAVAGAPGMTVEKKISRVIDKKLDVLEQLSKVNRHANDMLDLLIRWQSGDPEALRVLESQVRRVTHGEEGEEHEVATIKMKDPRELALRCMGEIREQLSLQVKIFETLYSLKAAEEFQTEVLDAIGEVAPDVRQRIIAKLNEKRALRQVVRWS